MEKCIISSLLKKEKNAVSLFIAICLYSTNLFTTHNCIFPVFICLQYRLRCLFTALIQAFLDTIDTANIPLKNMVNCEKEKLFKHTAIEFS